MPKTAPLTVGDIGFDSSAQFNDEQIAWLAANFKFGVRYVPLAGQSDTYAIKQREFDATLAAGLGLMLVQFPRGKSSLSSETGMADGQAAAAYALKLGYPPSACLWLDLSPAPSAAIAIEYANAWYKGATSGGMYGSALGVYCEPGVPLTSEQLYHSLTVARYWKTAGRCPDVATRGYQMLQLYPGNLVPTKGIVIDKDVVQQDYLQSIPLAAFKD
jgi:hypothetical protein